MLIPDNVHHKTRALWVTAAISSLMACGGSDSSNTSTPQVAALPQLTAAVGTNFPGNCTDLTATLSTLANTTVTAVNTIAAGSVTVAGQPVAEHCQVQGKMFQRTSAVDSNAYAIGFEIRLPKTWNGRFYHQGNGGIDGAVVTAAGGLGGAPVTNALHKGFAVLSSDAGHSGNTSAFGIDPQARLDYGYQAVGKLTPMAKSVLQKTYGKAPDRSYFGGCSNGGRHAMVTASRYANDYDGILAGAPGYNLPKAAVANIAGAQLYASLATTTVTSPADLETGFNVTERRLLAAAVLAKCDALDGVADGSINDIAACKTTFDLNLHVPTCTAARDGTCLSSAQKSAVAKIFNGPTISNGTQIYASFPYDAGIATGSVTGGPPTGVAFWEFFAPLNLDSGAVGHIFSVPPTTFTGFNGINYVLGANLDNLYAQIFATDATYTEAAMGFMTPPTPTNLSVLKARGAKIMAYHGASDQIFSINDTETWYKGLQANNAGDASNFARFFRVPGMGHCSGGPATDQFDMLDALVKWVEQGAAPDKVVATARGAGNAGGVNADVPALWAANRTRPLCAYPKIARYNGTGSVDLESSFTCQP